MGETSNVNLICNVDYFLASTKESRDNSEIAWVGPTKQRYDSTIFKLINILIFFPENIQQDKNCIIYCCNELEFQICFI